MNKIAISLNKEVPCEYICQQIEKLAKNFMKNSQDINGALLVIDIVKPVDGGDNHIPKITYDPNSPT
jgi:hypothetical protein